MSIRRLLPRPAGLPVNLVVTTVNTVFTDKRSRGEDSGQVPVRILIVDDHDIVRQGVRVLLRSRAEWEVCGEAEDGIDALEKIDQLKPDLVVLDVSMPYKDGLAVATELSRTRVPVKSVVLTMHNSAEMAAAVKRSGAKGFVVKSHAARDLLRAIDTILEGGVFFSE